MQVKRKSPIEIQISAEPYDARLLAYALRMAAEHISMMNDVRSVEMKQVWEKCATDIMKEVKGENSENQSED